jgi:hypothetical protein
MRNLRRLIWCSVLVLMLFVIGAMILFPTRPALFDNAQWIGRYLTDCATSNTKKVC